MIKAVKTIFIKFLPYILGISFILIVFKVSNIKEKTKLIELVPLIMLVIIFIFLQANLIKDVIRRKSNILWALISLMCFPTMLGIIFYTFFRKTNLEYKNKKKFVMTMFLSSVCSFLIVVFFNNIMAYVPALINTHMNTLLIFLSPVIFFISIALFCMFNYENGDKFIKDIYMCTCIFNMVPFVITILVFRYWGY